MISTSVSLATPRHGIIVLILAICAMAFACASGQKKTEPVPEWLTSTPADDRYFYAVGISGQTRNVKDAWNQAANRARAELGRMIVSHVSSRDLVISTSNSEYSRQLVEVLSDTELNYTEVIERWFDNQGSYGPANHYYVLVRMEKKRAAAILKTLQ